MKRSVYDDEPLINLRRPGPSADGREIPIVIDKKVLNHISAAAEMYTRMMDKNEGNFTFSSFPSTNMSYTVEDALLEIEDEAEVAFAEERS